MKGQMAYKDVNGHVWQIVDSDDATFQNRWKAISTDGLIIVESEFMDELLDDIDDIASPEWAKADPSDPVQIEALDRGAFPNEH